MGTVLVVVQCVAVAGDGYETFSEIEEFCSILVMIFSLALLQNNWYEEQGWELSSLLVI